MTSTHVSPIHSGRVHSYDTGPVVSLSAHGGPVLYWMHRDHRVRDNWGLLHAQRLAIAAGAPLTAVWCCSPAFLGAARRQFGFLLRGLEEVRTDLAALSIPFITLTGSPGLEVAAFTAACRAQAVVTDFDPLRIKQGWLKDFRTASSLQLIEVDSRNVVPCRIASDKREYAARTIRPKIHRLLPEYLDVPPAPLRHPYPAASGTSGYGPGADRTPLSLLTCCPSDPAVPEVESFLPGEAAAHRALADFISTRLPRYAASRNDPNADAVSLLSPYFHFGMLSVQRAVLEITDRGLAHREAVDAFVEEAVVRRELAENFCFHTPDYDAISAFPDWVLRTLDKHRRDEREYLYNHDTFERAVTHDPLWNGAQRQMVATGHMHGWLRMYWAKKILEWTPSVEEALRIAIDLNDRYQLDGRDPNGYTGIAWSLGGVHDRPWKERPVFGTVRYMNYAGARRKFDVARFESEWSTASLKKNR